MSQWRVNPIEEMRRQAVEMWLWLGGYHHQGNFYVTFANGGQVDLRELLVEFAANYEAELERVTEAARKLAEDSLAVALPKPVVIEKP